MDNRIYIYYDGHCPVCSRTMERYGRKASEQSFVFVDTTQPGFSPQEEGLDPEAVQKNLHLKQQDGRIVQGLDGLIALWERLPGHVWKARLVCLPGIYGLSWIAYRLFSRYRHCLYGFGAGGKS